MAEWYRGHSNLLWRWILIDFRLDRHDRNQLELKLNYGLQQQFKDQRFRAELYVFVPTVLAINSETYPAARFYSDTASFIRMSAPTVPLSELSRKSAVKPWASDVKEAIDNFAAGSRGDEACAEQGLKLLGCVFKSAVRDAHTAAHSDLNEALRLGDWDLAATHLEAYLDDLRTALRRIHKVGERSDQKGVPGAIRESWRAIDEYASLLAEESLTELVLLCDGRAVSSRLETVLESLRDMAVAQYEHRREQGFSSYAKEDSRNEYLPHRWRVLKRYISSALYLNVKKNQTGTWARDAIGMFAAGLAMLFAASATVMIADQWAATLSSAFIASMVMAYIIKDRIKELGKRYMGRVLKRFIADHLLSIVGADGARLGTAEESFQIQSTGASDPEVLRIRYAELDSRAAVEGRPEKVLSYSKDIVISSTALQTQFAGADGLTDIIRLNFLPFTRRMDEVWEKYRYVHPIKREVCESKCARVYHLNVVLRLHSQGALVESHRVRVVVNKKGIVRIEEVGAANRMLENDGVENVDAAGIRIFDD